MKLILWMLILFWAAILLLNVRAVHAIQKWVFSVRSVYIIMLLPASLFLCISTLRAIDNYRRKHPLIYRLLGFVAAIYGAYATLLSGDPIDPPTRLHSPRPRASLCSHLGIVVCPLWNCGTDESRSRINE